MKINELTPNAQILDELGSRLAKVRKQQGFSQIQLSEEAGLGVATLKRIEGGKDGQLESWLKLLKALNMADSIDAFIPERFASPMAEVLADRKKRPKRPRNESATMWGDEES